MPHYIPDSFEPKLQPGTRFHVVGQFDRRALATARYYYLAAAWTPTLDRFLGGPLDALAQQSRNAITTKMADFNSASETWWLAHLHHQDDAADWSRFFILPLGREGLSFAHLSRWATIPFGEARTFARQTITSASRGRSYSEEHGSTLKEIPDEEHPGETKQIEVKLYDVKHVFDYFSYYPGAEDESPLVVGLRLAYVAKQREQRFISGSANPTGLQLWTELPATAPDRGRFVAAMVRGLTDAVRQDGGSIVAEGGSEFERRFSWSNGGHSFVARTSMLQMDRSKSALIVDIQ